MWHNNQHPMLKIGHINAVAVVRTLVVITFVSSCCGGKVSRVVDRKVPRVVGLIVCDFGFREDSHGYISTIKRAHSSDASKCVWLHEWVQKTTFNKAPVTNLEPNYFVLFLGTTGDIVTAIECNGDHFRFVEAKKTFWSYYIGPIISMNDGSWQWGEIPNFSKIVKSLCATPSFPRYN